MSTVKPTSKGRVHDVFHDNLTQLAAQNKQQHAHERGQDTRPWHRPAKVNSPLDVPKVTEAFDRRAIDDNFADCVTNPKSFGKVGDTISLKTQGDYIAGMERAFRARHCTPVRLLGFAAARSRGHSDQKGVLLGGVLRYAQDALKAGQ